MRIFIISIFLMTHMKVNNLFRSHNKLVAALGLSFLKPVPLTVYDMISADLQGMTTALIL